MPGLAGLFLTMLALSALPGPVEFVLLARTLSLGARSGLAFIAGVLLADALLIALAWLGLKALLGVWPAASALLQAACGLWLLQQALSSWRKAGTAGAEPAGPAGTAAGSSLLLGATLTLADPRALLFYFGLLPAYLNLDSGGLAQVLLVLLLAALAIGLAKGAYLLLAARLLRAWRRPEAQAGLRRATAVVLGLLGGFLLLTLLPGLALRAQ